MTGIISDVRIAAMITEPKILPGDWRQELANLKNRVGRHESQIEFTGVNGTPFRIIASRRHRDADDFTLILMLNSAENPEFRLVRYDGSGHVHKNTIEGNRIVRKPHIHRATERYQVKTGQRRPDGYAEETERYQNLPGAWECFRIDLNLIFPDDCSYQSLPAPFTR